MRPFNENWDGIDRKTLNESDLLRLDDDFTDLRNAAKTVKTAMSAKPNMDIHLALSYLRQVVAFLEKKDAQQQEFLDRLVRNLDTAKKPSDVQAIVRELKKHRK